MNTFNCTKPCKNRTHKSSALSASSFDTGGSAEEVTGGEEKKIHLVLDGIVVRLQDDIDSAEKKHTDDGAAFKKAAKEAEDSKLLLDADKLTFGQAETTLGLAKAAVDKSAEVYKKESDEADAARVLAEDGTWKADVQNLESTIEAVATLRLAVEKLNDQYVHDGSTTSTTTAVPTTTTTTTTTTPGPSYVALRMGTKELCPAGRAVADLKECAAAAKKNSVAQPAVSSSWLLRPPGCYWWSRHNKYYWNTNSAGRNTNADAGRMAPVCRA